MNHSQDRLTAQAERIVNAIVYEHNEDAVEIARRLRENPSLGWHAASVAWLAARLAELVEAACTAALAGSHDVWLADAGPLFEPPGITQAFTTREAAVDFLRTTEGLDASVEPLVDNGERWGTIRRLVAHATAGEAVAEWEALKRLLGELIGRLPASEAAVNEVQREESL